MARNCNLLVVSLGLQNYASFATPSSEAKPNDQMQNGRLHGNQGSDQSQDFK